MENSELKYVPWTKQQREDWAKSYEAQYKPGTKQALIARNAYLAGLSKAEQIIEQSQLVKLEEWNDKDVLKRIVPAKLVIVFDSKNQE